MIRETAQRIVDEFDDTKDFDESLIDTAWLNIYVRRRDDISLRLDDADIVGMAKFWLEKNSVKENG